MHQSSWCRQLQSLGRGTGSVSSQSPHFGMLTSTESQISVNHIWQSPFLVSLQVSDVEKGVAEEVTLTTYLFLWEIIVLDIGEGAEKGQCSNNRQHPTQLYSHSKLQIFFLITIPMIPKIAPKYKIYIFLSYCRSMILSYFIRANVVNVKSIALSSRLKPHITLIRSWKLTILNTHHEGKHSLPCKY